jgi:RND family efflux transporter MFP subunit
MLKKILLITLPLISLLLTSCSNDEGEAGNNNINNAVPVVVSTVKDTIITRSIDLVGTLAPWKEANLGAQTTGRIEKIFVEEGSEVKEGDLLFQMDDTQLAQAKIQYDIAKDDFIRMEPLYEQGSISKQEIDKIKAAYESSEYSYKLLLTNTQFKAPFAGVITSKKMNEGEVFMLAPTGGAPAIVTLMQINTLKLEVSVSEKYFKNIKLGQKTKLEADAYPDMNFEGIVSKINPTIDKNTRTFDVEIKVPNANNVLRPGMYVRAKLYIGEEKITAVPRSAILRMAASNVFYAFVIENNTAKRVTITKGEEYDEIVEIKSGLNAGNVLVTTGQGMLKDDSRVKITEGAR